MLFLPRPPKPLLLGAQSGTLALVAHCLPSQVSNLADYEWVVIEMIDRLLHATHRVPILLLSLFRSL